MSKYIIKFSAGNFRLGVRSVNNYTFVTPSRTVNLAQSFALWNIIFVYLQGKVTAFASTKLMSLGPNFQRSYLWFIRVPCTRVKIDNISFYSITIPLYSSRYQVTIVPTAQAIKSFTAYSKLVCHSRSPSLLQIETRITLWTNKNCYLNIHSSSISFKKGTNSFLNVSTRIIKSTPTAIYRVPWPQFEWLKNVEDHQSIGIFVSFISVSSRNQAPVDLVARFMPQVALRTRYRGTIVAFTSARRFTFVKKLLLHLGHTYARVETMRAW